MMEGPLELGPSPKEHPHPTPSRTLRAVLWKERLSEGRLWWEVMVELGHHS